MLRRIAHLVRLIIVEQAHRDIDARGLEPPRVRLRRTELFEARWQVGERRDEHRHLGRRDLARDDPAFGRADEHELPRGTLLPELQHIADTCRAVDTAENRRRAVTHYPARTPARLPDLAPHA